MPRKSSPRPEIVIGLVAPIGTDLGRVIEELSAALADVNYRSHVIHISRQLRDIERFKDLAECRTEFDRYEKHMDAGDELRRTLDRDDAMAFLAVSMIQERRSSIASSHAKYVGDPNDPREQAFIIRSLKTRDEVVTLRGIYGPRFILIGASSPRRTRLHDLAQKLADSEQDLQSDGHVVNAVKLIERDEEDQEKPHGQGVRKTFPAADFFVDAGDPERLKSSVRRSIELLFGNPFITPHRDEFGMYLAHAAAMRSSALGRQVGAVITTEDGDVIAVGCNEVPKAGGGLYWAGDGPDRRDFLLGHDTNDIMKRRVLGDILKRLQAKGWLANEHTDKSVKQLVREAVGETGEGPMAGSQVENIIEFGRCVHAEMAAIVDAARRGVSIYQGIPYTSTFPCHECARHIVAAGIGRVVYLLPYAKSLVRELYPDSIGLEGDASTGASVHFSPFMGVSPRRFIDLFTMTERKKEDGRVVQWDRNTCSPRLGEYFPPFALVAEDEEATMGEFERLMRSKGLLTQTSGGDPV